MDIPESYESIAARLINDGILSREQIYYFDNNSLRQVFQDVFRWCQDDLVMDNKRYQLSNSKFIFINDAGVNAFARHTLSYQLIGVHMGLFETMFYSFFESSDLFDEAEFKHYEDFLNSAKLNAPTFLFWIFAKFIFFHELAHLLQSSRSGNFSMTENITDGSAVDTFNQQLREFDADNFGAVQIYIQVLHAAKQNLTENKEYNRSRYQSFVILGITSVFVFFLKLSGYNATLYFDGKSHPHPIVRLIYIIQSVMSLSHENKDQLGALDFDVVYDSVTKLSHRILSYNKNELLTFQEFLLASNGQVTNYAKILYETASKRDDLTINFFLSKHSKQRLDN